MDHSFEKYIAVYLLFKIRGIKIAISTSKINNYDPELS
jgi:hypothetical protein